MNRLHMEQIQQFGSKERSKVRHKLTLLDECGVIICIKPSQRFLLDLLRNHQWTQAFYQHKELWAELNPIIFGHANYEMATKPFIGLTAKLCCIELPEGLTRPNTEGYDFVDDLLATQLVNADLLLDNQQLSPLPLLGVPGWHQEAQDLDFYADTSYFRPKRQTT